MSDLYRNRMMSIAAGFFPNFTGASPHFMGWKKTSDQRRFPDSRLPTPNSRPPKPKTECYMMAGMRASLATRSQPPIHRLSMRIHVEGWPFRPQAYAIATDFLLREMAKRSDLAISYQTGTSANSDRNPILPECDPQFPTLSNRFPPGNDRADITLRISEVPNFTAAESRRTGIAIAPRWGTLSDESFSNPTLSPDVTLITPSRWSRDGLLRRGISPRQIALIPPGVDPEIFRPLTPEDRAELRHTLDWDYYFVFLHVSELSNADGLRPLLKAFAAVVEAYPHARLVLKGSHPQQSETALLEASRDILSDKEARRVQPRLALVGDTLSFAGLAKLYQAADAYLSPDVAPGMGLPILEAGACGLPIIYTAGSPAEEWTHPDFALPISSQFRTWIANCQTRFLLHPDWEHLAALMKRAIEQPELGTMARELVPQFVAGRFTWKHCLDRILDCLDPEKTAVNPAPILSPQKSSYQMVVEGWRSIPHSYALINSHQLLELKKRSRLELFHRDMPYVTEDWKPSPGLFSPEEEAILDHLPQPPDDLEADITLRMYCPFNLASSNSKITAVFGCTEWGIVPQTILRGMGVKSFRDAHLNSNSIIITASEWSRRGFLNSGAVPERVAIVPLGFDPKVHHPPTEDERNSLRKKFGWADHFVFLNIGVMWNERQGISRLLKAFVTVADRHPEAKLILKGRDAIFPSKDSIQKATKYVLTDGEIEFIRPRMRYIGENLSAAEIAQLYQAADVYVSPYSAEGFNMPVLEAIACGTPVICTKGGPTDEFARPEFSLQIESKLRQFRDREGDIKFYLEPQNSHLIDLMEMAIKAPDLKQKVRQFGTPFVRENFTWSKVCDRLLEVFLSGE
ncbi:MAG: glycosyltransferase family 4 protein [Limnospira sp.]